MKKILSALLLIALAVSCDCSEPDTPATKNLFKVEFTATPSTFSAEGGTGYIKGVLQELAPDGTIVSERKLTNGDYTLSIKEGDVDAITLDNTEKSFVVKAGDGAASFIFEATLLSQLALSQLISIHREAKPAAPKLPLAYVAEYNVNQAGDAFVATHTNSGCGYFKFDEAVEKFASITVDGVKYHLPSQAEWKAIVPTYKGVPTYVEFDHDCDFRDVEETVAICGTEVTSTNDYFSQSTGDIKATYAIRYKGTDLLSAWRYEFIDNPNGGKMMRITCRPISKGIAIEDVATTSFWEQENPEDVIHIFPACGYRMGEDIRLLDTSGYYWASDQENDERGWRMGYYSHCADSGNSNPKKCGFTIRLFGE